MLFLQGPESHHGGPTLTTPSPPKVPTSKFHSLWVRASTYEFAGGVTNRWFITGSMGGNQLGGPGRTPRSMSQSR